MQLEYSYTTIDRSHGRARTFTVRTESRELALSAIRAKVQEVNRGRARAGVAPLERPSADQLDAHPTRSSRPSGLVAFYA